MKQKSWLMLIALNVALLGCFSARTAAGEPVKIMPLGDSITAGVGTTPPNGYRKPLYLNLTNRGYNVDFVGSQTDGNFPDPNHEGHNGYHAADIITSVYNWLVDANGLDIVLLHIGTNDITAGDEDANDVNDILAEIERYEIDSSKGITVILALIINRQSHSSATTQFNNDVNDMALNRIANGDDIIIVDMESALNYSTDMSDPVHPNEAGYAKMADVWYDALDNLLAAAPTITSTPVTNATVGELYTYDVDANGFPEPDYTLTTYPSGMTIDSNTGLIEWVPAAAGDFNVTVEVSNGKPPDANQSFTITVFTIIKFDAASSQSGSTEGNYLGWTHTIGSGDDRILVVGIAGRDNDPCDLIISSVTYNDANMSPVVGSSQSVGSYLRTELYYLLDSNLPSPGSYMVEVNYSGNVNKRCGGAISLFNVGQQAAEIVDTNSSIATDFISTNITTQTDSAWVVDVVGCDKQGSLTADEVDGQIERFDTGTNGSTVAGSTKLVPLAGSTTMSWSHSSGSGQLAQSVAAFAPANRAISGYILDFNDVPIDGVSVDANNAGGFDTTDPNGCYEVSVPYGWSGTVTPTKAEYVFAPPERTYSDVIANQSNQDYEDVSIYDLDDNGFIDLRDLDIIYENWLVTGPDVPGDIHRDSDNIVNLLDFAKFALVWQAQ